jgi:hypothetical protein
MKNNDQSPLGKVATKGTLAKVNKVFKIKWVTVGLVTLVLLFFGTTFYFVYQNYQLKQYLKQLRRTTKADVSKFCPNIENQAKQNKFSTHLQTFYKAYGAPLYSKFSTKDNGLQSFYDSYSFINNGENYEITMFVYKNFDGLELEQNRGSEQSKVSFDGEVNTYQKLDIGIHQAKVWDSVQEVTVRNIGSRKYLVYDSRSAPSATVARNYFIFIEKTRNLIYFSLLSYHDWRETESSFDNRIYKVKSYPDNFQSFINEVEQTIAKI